MDPFVGSRPLRVRLRFLRMTIRTTVKSKVKGVGQECPTHTSKIKIKVKGRRKEKSANGRCTAARYSWAAWTDECVRSHMSPRLRGQRPPMTLPIRLNPRLPSRIVVTVVFRGL
jgi:hypothetical protein